jgi:hypothetical protein
MGQTPVPNAPGTPGTRGLTPDLDQLFGDVAAEVVKGWLNQARVKLSAGASAYLRGGISE